MRRIEISLANSAGAELDKLVVEAENDVTNEELSTLIHAEMDRAHWLLEPGDVITITEPES